MTELKDWMQDLARDRNTIGSSLSSISDLTVVVADLLRDGRPLLKADVAELRELAALLTTKQSRKLVVELLDRLPESMTDQTRTGTYGSWYSYYICGFSAEINLPKITGPPARASSTSSTTCSTRSTSAARRRGATHEAARRRVSSGWAPSPSS